jgi:hypothetical protein
LARDEAQGRPAYCLGGVRPEGGVSLVRAAMWNVGTCVADAKGEVQVGSPHEDQSTNAADRGGVARSSDEACESTWSKGAALSGYGHGPTSKGPAPMERRNHGSFDASKSLQWMGDGGVGIVDGVVASLFLS